jgi:hypothetical protein
MSWLVQVEFQFQGIVGAGRVSISRGEDASSYTKSISRSACITIKPGQIGRINRQIHDLKLDLSRILMTTGAL